MIYTSYISNLKNIPKHIVPITICGKTPLGWNGKQYKKLAPKWEFFSKWKNKTFGCEECFKNNEYYTKEFYDKVLNKLNIQQVLNELYELSGGSENIVLLCYEKPDDFCHRHLVADWMKGYGIEIEEWK